ncbi:MAG: hypothetical protein IJI23_11930 [Lachnospiraceae bacterium]|nr:hypothetical protein [Lachnospiraceae bacterium]
MDKYEYQVCADQIKSLIKEHRFQEAMDIADTIDWRRVKSFSMLCTVSEIYKVTKHYSEARDILLLAYERYPDRANVVYALCELAIKLDEIPDAIDYYREYVHLKPHDTNRYVLLYKIYDAQDVPLEEKISLLEEFKRAEYTEKWAYELALLYHKDGQETKCVETCDELALWFGDGPYVRKALELKMQHSPLTKEQQQKYDGVYDAPKIPTGETEETVHIYETQSMPIYAKGASPYETAPMDGSTGSILSNASNNLQGNGNPMPAQTAQPVQPVQTPVQPAHSDFTQTSDIQIAPYSNDKYSTMNLQEELARNMEEFYAKEQNVIPTPYYGVTSQLYDQSQEQFIQQLNQAGPVYQQPVYEQQPAYEQPAYQQPVYEQPVYQQPVYEQQPQPIEQPQEPQIQESQPQQPQPQQLQPQPAQQIQQPQPVQQIQQPQQPQETVNPEDEQVPGQIDLSDFMRDWEEKKKSGEEQRKQQILNKTKEQTQDIMAQLAGVIPGIENAVNTEPEPAKSPEQTQADNQSGKVKEEENRVTEEVIKDDKKGVVTRTTIPSPVFERENVKRTESGARINGPATTSITEAIPDILPDANIPLSGDVLPSGRKLTLAEEYGGNIAQIRKEDVELVKRMTGELPETEEKIPEPEASEPEPEDYGETEEIEEVEQPDLPEDEVVEEVVQEPIREPEHEQMPEASEPAKPLIEEVPEEKAEEQIKEKEPEPAKNEASVIRHGLTAPIQYPYNVDDLGEVEELETIDQPDEVDDMLKTRPIPQEEIEARMRYEAGIEEEYSAEEEAPKRANHPSWMKLEENVTSRREFDDTEMAIFGRFEGIESLKAQIVDVMDDMKMEASHGNVIVMGSENFGRKGLAIDIVKAIQTMDSTFSGKVAKISGEALNKKNIPMTLQKLRNGALIVENAGGLTPITVNAITESLQNEVDYILVVFEGEKETLEPLLNGCVETKSVFDARIVIDDFSNSDLVAYAKGYARELEYSIDDMGTLALYNKIGDMQTIDHVVTVDEVIEIVDNAIHHVDRKNMAHFMDFLLAKRYDDDDYIVLREKDFLN